MFPYGKLFRMRNVRSALAAALLLGGLPRPAGAQDFGGVGTRAAGMGGAFVAVADDASAVYWNPAGFAAGSIVSLVLDRTGQERLASDAGPGGRQSGWLLALGAPAVALSYYRLRATELSPAPGFPGADAGLRAATLVTHHAGATVVQTLVPGVSVGATLKLVRGLVSSGEGPLSSRDDLLGDRSGPAAQGSTRFDADLGVMAAFGPLKAGLTLRNATAPSFRGLPGETPVRLERQARAGVSLAPLAGWILAADTDVTGPGAFSGRPRRAAAGTEGRVHSRLVVRGGVSAALSGDRAAALSAGASFAATRALMVDASVTGGGDRAARGWGLAARVGY